ncbi:MAG: hypothetical protein NDJ92_15140, partial [Thermoanaerobaculia bacterium]|nr:hypothetical protein [Thermoanaerobaculia bacterium]
TKNATFIDFPVFDSPSPFGHGSSGIVLRYCPWCGVRFSDTPLDIDPMDNPNPILPAHPGAGTHCCEMMNIHTSGEDLIVIYDEVKHLYVRPIFDGSHETAFLGRSGIVLKYCPWSGDVLPSSGDSEALEEIRLPGDLTNPRY